MKNTLRATVLLYLLSCAAAGAMAQSEPSPILFIYDASGSMWGQMEGRTKKEIAAEVLSTVVQGLPEQQQVGLMAYGHREKGDCEDIESLADIDNRSKAKLVAAVKAINPLGKTPLARSAALAIAALKAANVPATIILVTDGIESCDGNICEVVAAAKAEGIKFKLHIVGFGIEEGSTELLKCAANAGGGQYYDVADAESLGEVLGEATAKTVDEPAPNCSIYTTKNGKPVDAWVRAYKVGAKDAVENSRTYRDTARIYLPAGQYEIEVRPLENTDLSETRLTVVIEPGENIHRTVSFDAATLNVTVTNNEEGWDAIVKMHNRATGSVAASLRTYGRDKSMQVDPGRYDITFQALNIEGLGTTHKIEDVALEGGQAKAVAHNFETGIAQIGVRTKAGELIDAAVNFTEINSGKNVAGARTYTSESSNPKAFLLTAGTYSVKVTTLGKHKGQTESFTITVKAGQTAERTLSF